MINKPRITDLLGSIGVHKFLCVGVRQDIDKVAIFNWSQGYSLIFVAITLTQLQKSGDFSKFSLYQPTFFTENGTGQVTVLLVPFLVKPQSWVPL